MINFLKKRQFLIEKTELTDEDLSIVRDFTTSPFYTAVRKKLQHRLGELNDDLLNGKLCLDKIEELSDLILFFDNLLEDSSNSKAS